VPHPSCHTFAAPPNNIAIMSSSHAPTSPPSETEDPRTIVYDPNDPFWRDTEDDDDDMDYLPAEGGSETEVDEEGNMHFHGRPLEET
jgi:WD repeat-containing protein 23